MSDSIYLCVMSDDFGMHPAVNDGIVQAFCDGLLTDANLMAPCPSFRDAAAQARATGLPVGFHGTLTCDWDVYKWGPLTNAPSLVTADGYFKHLCSLAWSEAKDNEVLAELTAQVEAIEAEGLKITHSSYHMGTDGRGRMFRAYTQIGMDRVGPLRRALPVRNGTPGAVAILTHQWQTAFFSSEWSLDYAERKAMLIDNLRKMQPGYHLWMVHAAIDHPSLDDLCTPDFFARDWARPFRALDQALLMDTEIKDLLEELGIQRVPVSQVPSRVIDALEPDEE